jgi:hypothetical protein
MGRVIGGVFLLCLAKPLRDFAGEFGLGLHHAGVAHRLVLGGIRPQLGAVHRNMAEADQTSALA